ncbi:hypothetical protein Lesp02_33190 [Lentzea sp. NBRC 105346]|uniref:nucleotidyltransferase domain-containing protein n=1 Tax=Lentzea sp. NBRC 105346 TaxID=3032205 RepID=UPI0024A33FFE|nr:nucleotidyltransferase domain-containing protein [Lentzea sp. NBRC 105346]GLZ31131.1 hypothetical protein Lesp02_33190 [Lentzea sp. NBRC 105346]
MTTASEHLAQLPFVVGAHVVGSRVLGDAVEDSDLDLVVELSDVPDLGALAAAQAVDLDVIYVLAGQLALPVSSASSIAWGRDGKLHTDRADLTPVLWEQLARYADTVVGESPTPPVTRDEVVAYCRANLVSYWEPLLDRASEVFASRTPGPVFRDPLLWIAFGPARLWHTIRTGGIVSKTQAAELAAVEWPDLSDLLLDLASARRDPSVMLTIEHAVAALELGRRVLAA